MAEMGQPPGNNLQVASSSFMTACYVFCDIWRSLQLRSLRHLCCLGRQRQVHVGSPSTCISHRACSTAHSHPRCCWCCIPAACATASTWPPLPLLVLNLPDLGLPCWHSPCSSSLPLRGSATYRVRRHIPDLKDWLQHDTNAFIPWKSTQKRRLFEKVVWDLFFPGQVFRWLRDMGYKW